MHCSDNRDTRAIRFYTCGLCMDYYSRQPGGFSPFQPAINRTSSHRPQIFFDWTEKWIMKCRSKLTIVIKALNTFPNRSLKNYLLKVRYIIQVYCVIKQIYCVTINCVKWAFNHLYYIDTLNEHIRKYLSLFFECDTFNEFCGFPIQDSLIHRILLTIGEKRVKRSFRMSDRRKSFLGKLPFPCHSFLTCSTFSFHVHPTSFFDIQFKLLWIWKLSFFVAASDAAKWKW